MSRPRDERSLPFSSPTIMSARQPFVPNASRPASRTAHSKDPSQFHPDRNNPLHTEPKPFKSNAKSDADSSNNVDSKPDFLPLPLGSFKKQSGTPANRPFKATANISRRPSGAENANSRSAAAQAPGSRSKPTLSDIAAPTPVSATSPLFADSSASGMFTASASSTFKTPALPMISSAQQSSNESNAHIHKPHETDPLALNVNSFKLNTSLSNQTPQRVLLPDSSPDMDRNDAHPQGGMNGHLKRSRVDLDYDDDSDMSYEAGPAKRYKHEHGHQARTVSYYLLLGLSIKLFFLADGIHPRSLLHPSCFSRF